MTISSTPESQNPINYQTIKDEINALQRDVRKYPTVLNHEAIWLFLATLGCWSVSNGVIQFVALVITFLLFYKRNVEKTKGYGFFYAQVKYEQVKTIEDRIAQTSLPDDSKEALLVDLTELKKNEMSVPINLKNSWVFIICWLFYGVSFLYWVYSVFHDYSVFLKASKSAL